MHIKTLVIAVVLCTAVRAQAQIRVHPTGVNVSSRSATTVLLTFGGIAGYVPIEALWCGELISAAPAVGNKCDPSSVYGALPIALDLSRPSGVNGLTDVMSVPTSVARRAYQAAAAGQPSSFFYVRRFVKPGEPDQYVTVTCRLSGGGARTPLSLVDVEIVFASQAPIAHVDVGARVPTISARLVYTGTGRLIGRWEIVLPGQATPTSGDLLTAGALPREFRDEQRRYTELSRFDVFLDPSGRYGLAGPPIERLPTGVAGSYLVLLRIEASDDKEADTDLGAAGAGSGVVHAGGVAGFPMPLLRYTVGGDAGELGGITPVEGATVRVGDPLEFRWTLSSPLYFRLEVEASGRVIHQALLQADKRVYRLPRIAFDKLPAGDVRWRVVPVDAEGHASGTTTWRHFTVIK